jgi:hypothetical protein
VRASGLTADNEAFASAQFEEVGTSKVSMDPTILVIPARPWQPSTTCSFLPGKRSMGTWMAMSRSVTAECLAITSWRATSRRGVWHQKPGWGEEGRVPIAHDGYFFVDFTKAGKDHEATSFWLRVVPRTVTDIPNCGLDPAVCLIRRKFPGHWQYSRSSAADQQ